MDDVPSRRIARKRGFGTNRRQDRADVGFRSGVFGIVAIARKGEKPYGREDGEHGNYDDEFGQSET